MLLTLLQNNLKVVSNGAPIYGFLKVLRTRTKQPKDLARLNNKNTFANNVFEAAYANSTGMYSVITNSYFGFHYGYGESRTPKGDNFYFQPPTSGNYLATPSTPLDQANASDITTTITFMLTGNSYTSYGLFNLEYGGGIDLKVANGVMQLVYEDFDAADVFRTVNGIKPILPNILYTVSIVRVKGVGFYIYTNGVLDAGPFLDPVIRSSYGNLGRMCVPQYNFGAAESQVLISLLVIHQLRALKPAEIREFHCNPWQMFENIPSPSLPLQFSGAVQTQTLSYGLLSIPRFNRVQPQQGFVVDTSWITPRHLWVPTDNTIVEVMQNRNAYKKAVDPYITKNSLGTVVKSPVSSTYGYYTDSFGGGDWYTGLSEITIFAVAILDTTTSVFNHLLRLDGNASTTSAQINLACKFDGLTLVHDSLLSTNSTTGWDAASYTTVSADSSFKIGMPYLHMYRYKNGGLTQISVTPLGSKVNWINSAKQASGTVSVTANGLMEMHVGGLALTGGENAWLGSIGLCGVLPYSISDSAANKLAGNPWQIFKQSPKRIPVSNAIAQSITYRRAILWGIYGMAEITNAQLSLGFKPLVLYNGQIKERVATEGVPIIMINGNLQTLASSDTLQI